MMAKDPSPRGSRLRKPLSSPLRPRAWSCAAIGLAAVIVLAHGDAQAQSARRQRAQANQTEQAPDAVGAEPQETSATFGDWVVRCDRIQQTGATTRICEVAESLVVRGQQAPIAQIAIGRPENQQGLRLTMLLPVNISFDQAPQLQFSQNDPLPIALAWRRCIPNGCFADAPVASETLKRLRAATSPMRITFKDASERALALPLSPRGLPQALDALAKQDTNR
jgi:invasion protein IalB